MKTIHLIACPDGTDEQYSLRTYSLVFQEGETAGDALERLKRDEYADWDKSTWDYGDDLSPFEHFSEWWDGFSWQLQFWDPDPLCDHIAEERDTLLGPDEGSWMSADDLLAILRALAPGK